MLHFVISHIILFAIFSSIVLICTYGAAIIFSYVQKNFKQTFQLLWLYALATVLILNARLYPDSDYASYFLSNIYNNPLATVFAYVVIGCILVFSTVYFATLMNRYRRIAAISLITFAVIKFVDIQHQAEIFEQPNIVIIGVDSLRPDVLDESSNPAPFISALTKSNKTYANAYTPLARTFPSWVTTLTGKYPRNSGMRVNLQTVEDKDIPNSLGHFLQDEGYFTLYATDEKRFSNIDARYGFNEVVGPSIGIHDFLFGHIADFPLSNLTSEWGVSKFLFPYTYANRAIPNLYNPDTYVDLALDKISTASKQKKPLFIATHFCLPHWPFTWKDHQISESRLDNYLSTVGRADQQVEAFIEGLDSLGLLQNAIIVLISDHGETFLARNVNFNDPVPTTNFNSHLKDFSNAHGTDLVSINQNRILMSFIDKTINNDFAPQLLNHEVVSLTDIAPTLIGYLYPDSDNQLSQEFDGISLTNPDTINQHRSVFLETGFTVSSINDITISIENVIEESIDFYKVDEHSGRLTVLPDKQPKIIATKQRGIANKDWLLVHSPQPMSPPLITLVDLNTGNGYGDTISRGMLADLEARRYGYIQPLQAKHAETAKQLYLDLKSFYGSEIDDSSDHILNRFGPDPMNLAQTQN